MKKALYILFILFGCCLTTIGVMVLFLKSSRIQTAAVQLLCDEISRALGVESSIQKVEYHFPASIDLQEVYLSDQQNDTLLYLKTLQLHFNPFALSENKLDFGKINLSDGRIKIYQNESKQYNYQFLLNAFADTEEKEDTISLIQTISLRDIQLNNIKIDYNDYLVEVQECQVSLDHLSRDSLYGSISKLAGFCKRDKDIFILCETQAQLFLSHTQISFPTLSLRTPHSELDLSGFSLSLPQSDSIDLHNQADQIIFSMRLNKAILQGNDFALFDSKLRKVEDYIELSADINGQLDSINAQDLGLWLNGERLLSGNVKILGLPDPKQLYLRTECQDLYIRANILQDVVSHLYAQPFVLPAEVHRLGDIHYHGQLEGNLANLRLRGAFRTQQGVITTEGKAKIAHDMSKVDFSGRISTKRFRLGRLLNNNDMDAISVEIKANGSYSERGVDAQVSASIDEFCYKNYCYADIQIDGEVRENEFNGTFSIEDENINLHFNGIVDLSMDVPELNCDLLINHLRPGQLGLLGSIYENLDIAGNFYLNFAGNSLTDMIGYFLIDSLTLINEEDSVLMQRLKLTLSGEGDLHKHIVLASDFMTGRIDGNFEYTTLPLTLKRVVANLLPNIFLPDQLSEIKEKKGSNTLDMYLYGHQLQSLQRVLRLPWRIGDYPTVKLYLDDNGTLRLHASLTQLRSAKQTLDQLTLTLEPLYNKTALSFSTKYASGEYQLFGWVGNDSIVLNINGIGKDADLTGKIGINSHISRYAKQIMLTSTLQESDIQFRDSVYHINKSNLVYTQADTTLSVDGFRIGGDVQFVEINGVGSTRSSDSLCIRLGDINAAYILPFVLKEETLTVGGNISGQAAIYNLFSKPVVTADITLSNAAMNETPLGGAKAVVSFNNDQHSILIKGDVNDSIHRSAHVDGTVDLHTGHWQLDIQPDSFPLAFINHWTQDFIDQIDGTVSGSVSVSGQNKNVWVIAKAQPHNASLRIPYTGCYYSFNDSVFMDSTAIRFPNITVYDEEHNPLHLDGVINHHSFKDFRFNIDVQVDHALALNMPDKAGELLQGKVYAQGDVSIHGDDNEIRLDAQATTVGNSRFRISIDGANSASENSFVSFVNHNELPPATPIRTGFDYTVQDFVKPTTRPTPFRMSLNVDVTPSVLVQLVLNDRTGDMIQARGEGAVRFTMDENNDIRLLGTVSLQEGSMGFTLANMIHRDFTIAEGSQIIWNGVAESPQLDVTAKYRVTASLKDLFGDETSTLTTSRTSVPVNTCVNLTGALDNPTIRFALELPSSEEAIQTQVQSVINTDEMLMRQVVYLLVFGRFYTPEYMQNTSSSGLNETYSLLSSTITGQINSWLGKLTDAFTLGINIRTDGLGAEGSQEYEAQFQIQPVNRLIINGNFGYRYNDITNRPFFGDLDIEYILTPDGKLRAKAYTQTVDKYSLRQASTIQGVGFIIKHDFNWGKKKKKDSTPTDSMHNTP